MESKLSAAELARQRMLEAELEARAPPTPDGFQLLRRSSSERRTLRLQGAFLTPATAPRTRCRGSAPAAAARRPRASVSARSATPRWRCGTSPLTFPHYTSNNTPAHFRSKQHGSPTPEITPSSALSRSHRRGASAWRSATRWLPAAATSCEARPPPPPWRTACHLRRAEG